MADEDARPERSVPSGMADWTGASLTLHLTGAGRVKSLTGVLVDIAGDGFVIAEDDADWWVPREYVQAVRRPRGEAGS